MKHGIWSLYNFYSQHGGASSTPSATGSSLIGIGKRRDSSGTAITHWWPSYFPTLRGNKIRISSLCKMAALKLYNYSQIIIVRSVKGDWSADQTLFISLLFDLYSGRALLDTAQVKLLITHVLLLYIRSTTDYTRSWPLWIYYWIQ